MFMPNATAMSATHSALIKSLTFIELEFSYCRICSLSKMLCLCQFLDHCQPHQKVIDWDGDGVDRYWRQLGVKSHQMHEDVQ